MTAVSSRLMRAKLDSVNLTYYMAPPSALMTLPFMLTFEYSTLTSRWATTFAGTNIVFILLLSGLIALALNVSTFLAIKATSALTFTVIGNIKVIFSIVISVIIFKNEIGLFNAFGCAVTIAGAWWYSQIQHEVKTRKQQTPELPVASTSEPSDRK
jgi:drug/metabolite transporter (DMT)-like permease